MKAVSDAVTNMLDMHCHVCSAYLQDRLRKMEGDNNNYKYVFQYKLRGMR